MTSTIEARWQNAQQGERRFHCDEVAGFPTLAARRQQEAEMRRFYAGMLRITPGEASPAGPSVTDIGCGPESLLLSSFVSGGFAVDPLTFSDDDEARYRARGITRERVAAEEYVGAQTEEVWLYNCLQHVRDPERVLAVAMAHARDRVRIFEWCDVPTDALHLHTLSVAGIRGPLWAAGWTERYTVVGRAAHLPFWGQSFYSGVWEAPQ